MAASDRRAKNLPRLGRSLLDLRKERGWSRKELAERSGLSYPYISQLENGDREPSFDTLTKLAQTFGLAVDALLAPSANQRPARVRPEAPGGQRWIPNPNYHPNASHRQRPPAGPPSQVPASGEERIAVVDAAYRILLALPPDERLDAAGALLARCLKAAAPPTG
ncbi:helix-turn-helix transcriptional regulator [Streptomyces sp. NPDC005727]|uniref:helix-turn-helix domain-containing protein n=1 Tax=Streptomyces sp. NPDC005727 TaxID=3157053 RepID=UPI0033C48EE2